ncbi:hypothetical protein BDA96_10G139000 [Sorghum bicolor]|jgi:hypothetical protein|uniref:RING-type domain-containing protein n=2 Tax=Sorghum bicolor TaxID=4558 RepID=A0A194YIH9_SORBI|nr:E3 ubiquitin-protein ligase ATL41 [Sorghum bicolor]KAG0513852.1 hypothetical protein BDA96_10G139000 [Sorghum bicolor]KXG19779.1 hypothetical protein SORBI_3010G113800 [Sorghum bicolor]OQU76221.1 hypothetical protein SORBI_3010G113800 [Sorghum bicolor]|eukprot:XP_002438223.2 E3 ubiquitin-protein ligase ATL41 [Sorghum bicolor]
MIMTNPAAILSVALLIVGVSLMLAVHILVVFWALRRGLGSRDTGQHANHQDQERVEDGHGRRGLSPGELVTLPCHDFKAADGEAAGDCAVCLEAFQAGDRCRQLPRCEHCFHAECVDSWLRKSSKCPVCRADVVDRPPKGEAKAAASGPGVVEMAGRRSSNAALEIVTER